MAVYERYITWYAPWPLINGPSFDRQVRNIRWDTTEAAGAMRSALLEIDDSAPYHQAEKVLKGLSFGRVGFKDKFRFYYARGGGMGLNGIFHFQLNTGTQAVPAWVDIFTVDDTGMGQVVFGLGGAQASLGGWYY